MAKEELSYFKRFIFSKSIIFTVRIIVALVFLYSGSVKILNLYQFGEIINNYHILPSFLIIPFASLITTSEIILGIMFLLGVYEKETAVLLILLNIVFIFAMASAIIRGIDTSCGCFSQNGEVVGIKDIVRDIVFIMLILLVLMGRKYGKNDS
ncbi:DoxX family protein [Thermotomaculum hydrothermale]|uniref:DoxX family protein n=1 Tax=Thermotomaculum hydrothermale TaxID=981385 RepID=A0A7R6Q0C0_9BACT|nr:MauE/DoxX family redox-associated membrane protein [Thermotomaculum hydrothermale]BBB33163.1 DoxX family protein [Thermotomaculum hydrothermale]